MQMNMNAEESKSQERGCYTVEELMSILCVGRKAIYSLIHRKAFPALRIGSVCGRCQLREGGLTYGFHYSTQKPVLCRLFLY